MLNPTFEIPHINSSARIIELDSDEDEYESNFNPQSKTAPIFKAEGVISDDKELHKVQHSLPTLEPSEKSPTPALTVTHPIRSNKISSTLDPANILPEGMKRTHQLCKQSYAIGLQTAAQRCLTAYHSAFSAFSVASAYYNETQTRESKKREQQILATQRLH